MTLLDRLESAEEGSRDLDAEIASERIGFDAACVGGAGWPDGELIIPMFPGWQVLPYFTTSIDAALTLVPEGFGRGAFNFQRDRFGRCCAVVWTDVEFQKSQRGAAKTPALAICAAALRAQGVE